LFERAVTVGKQVRWNDQRLNYQGHLGATDILFTIAAQAGLIEDNNTTQDTTTPNTGSQDTK
jgi:hypothetical protein